MTRDVGIVTATLNSAATLQRTLDSVLMQPEPPVEHVFVDGGSTDGTLEILESHAKVAAQRGISTRIVPQEGRGITPAWNAGLRLLRAEIVAILNSDDWWEPNALAIVRDAFGDSSIGVVTGSMRTHDANGATKLLRPRAAAWLPVLMPFNHPATFVRRSVYDHIGTFDERYRVSADYDLLFRADRAGIKFARVQQTLTNMQLAGYSTRFRTLGYEEMRDIGVQHARIPVLPRLAYRYRLARLKRAATGTREATPT